MSFNSLLTFVSNYININPILLSILIALSFILIGFLFRHIIVKGIIKSLLKLANKTKTNLDELLVNALEKPALVFISGFSVWCAFSILPLPITFQPFLNRILRSFFIIIIFWFFYRSADSIIWIFERYINKTNKKSSPVLIGIFRKALKIVIILLEIFMIIKEWGYDVSGLIAGLGVGGLAFSLAAKDAASNLLGSITIMSDKTYSIGDWVQTDKIEGTVEEIGFRSTKIRTFSDALISVPNSIMSNDPVTNWSKMGKRRVTYTLHIPLDTPTDKITTLTSRLKEMLMAHEDIKKDFIVVNLTGFGEATLQIMIYYFTKTTSWTTYLSVSEDVNLKVIKIFEELGVIIIPPHRMIVENTRNIIEP